MPTETKHLWLMTISEMLEFCLDGMLKEMGFQQTSSDPCLYVNTSGEFFIIAVYVDDLLLSGHSDKKIKEMKQALGSQFKMKVMGELRHFLGVQVIQDKKNGYIWIGQSLYTRDLLLKFQMDGANSVMTPVSVGQKLVKATEESALFDEVLYQSAVGSLLYLATRTRLDIAYAVGSVARFCSLPTSQHWTAVKRIMRYLKGSADYGLEYCRSSEECVGYSDADWAGDVNDYKSISGYLFQIGGTAITWKSKKQSCVALLTAEAEYMSLAGATQEAIWLRQLLSDLKRCPSKATQIYEDNQSTICMAKKSAVSWAIEAHRNQISLCS